MIVDIRTLQGRQLDAALQFLLSKDYVQGRFIAFDGDSGFWANQWQTNPALLVGLIWEYVISLENTTIAEWSVTCTDNWVAKAPTLAQAVVQAVCMALADSYDLELPDEVLESHAEEA